MIRQFFKLLQKEEAIKRLMSLSILPDVIEDFVKNGTVYYSERMNEIFDGILFSTKNKAEFVEIIKDFEERNDALVYHAHLTHTEFGDLLSLLYVSKYQEEWIQERDDLDYPDSNGVFNTIARVVNIENPSDSDTGYIGIQSLIGGITRVY